MAVMRQWACLFLALTLVGCGSSRKELLTQDTNATAKGDATPLVEEGNGYWAKRGERAMAEKAIATWEKAAEMDPTRADIQLKLTYGYYFHANVHIRWDDDSKEAQQAAFDKGVIAGEKAIKLTSPDFAAAIKAGKSWEEAIPLVKSDDGLGAMYWYASNLGKWMILEGIATALKYKGRVVALMEHCVKLNDKYFYGGPRRYFGVYWSKVPFSSDPVKSKDNFEKSIAIDNTYLETKVFYCREYAVRQGDRALCEKLLKEVLDANADTVNPDLVPENKNAQRQAKMLMDNLDEEF